MNLTELRDEKGRLSTQADAILQKAVDEKRKDLTAEEDAQFDAIHADIAKLSKQIDRFEKQQALNEGTGRRTEPNPIAAQPKSNGQITAQDRDMAFRTWCKAGAPADDEKAAISEAERSNAARCGVDLNRRHMTLRMLPAKPLRGIEPEAIRDWRGQFETRAALTGLQSSTTTGGYTVADEAMQALEVALLQFGAMRQVSTIYRTATGGPLPFPTVNDTTAKGRLISENSVTTETEMTFGQLVLDAWKYSSDYILASVEFMNDSSINVAGFLGNALGTRIGRLQNDHFTTGSGSQPNGVVTAASSGVTSVTDPPTYDNVVDLLHSVDPAYRPNGRFMMNDTTLKSLKKIKVLQYSGDTTGYPLWSPGLAPGQPDTILGFPYTINQSMANPGSSAKKMLFGDFSKYIIRDVVDVTLLRLDERFAEYHQVAFLAFARSDGDLLDAGTHPIKYMQQA